jgi:hypothetical protein
MLNENSEETELTCSSLIWEFKMDERSRIQKVEHFKKWKVKRRITIVNE